MFLSTMILMGAFHVHSTFQYSMHRQDEITRMQQTMKVTRDLLDRRLRAAGAGMVGKMVAWCGGEHLVGPFMIHNSNVIGTSDAAEGGADPDPDWFEILSSDKTRNGYLTNQHPVTGVIKQINNPQDFPVGGLIGIKGQGGVCIFMVTSNNGGHIQYRQGGSDLFRCYNETANKFDCEDNVLGQKFLEAGSEILNFSSGTFGLRIDNSNPRRPILMMASGVAGGDASQYTWQPIAEHVEDMQVGVYLDTSNPPDEIGDVWVNSRDLTALELGNVRAVRISLVFRSASEIPGWQAGRRPALEDRPAATTTDGYLRRVMTTTVKLRNMP